MGRYDKMSDTAFDRILLEVMNKDGMGNVLTVPGVYEAVSEHYNNEVLDTWDEEQALDLEA